MILYIYILYIIYILYYDTGKIKTQLLYATLSFMR